MEFIETPIKDLYLIQPKLLTDERGFFTRIFCKELFSKIGFDKEFVQFNHSFNSYKGTIRGMHYQKPPFAETKFIRCVQGKVYDVAIDLRKNSPTYLNYFGAELSADNMTCILIPEGFAHGFQTLEDNSALIYHHTSYYTPNIEGGIRFNDTALSINWQLPPVNVTVKDKQYPLINQNFEPISL
jgi:dTDP-4-dehydrorhamnose 3,5-epimerase